ncbi:MAG: hypothetical protein ACYDDF_11480 [Thermoplasmatota archaeon]
MNAIHHEGSLKFQLGKAVSNWQDAIRAGDVGAQADLLAAAITVVAPKLYTQPTDERRDLLQRLDTAADQYAKAGRDRDGRATRTFLRTCQDLMAELLRLMSARQVYSFAEREYGDSDNVVQPVTQRSTDASDPN